MRQAGTAAHSSKRLSDREMKLERVDTIVLAWENGCPVRQVGPALQEFRAGVARASFEMRRIWAERQVQPHRTDRRAVADTESNRMNHIVKSKDVLWPGNAVHCADLSLMRLIEPERNVLQPAVYVSEVPEQHAAD